MFNKKILILLLGIVLLVLYFFISKIKTTPDLSNCDRLILQFQKSPYDYFTQLLVRESLIDINEKEYLKSLNNIEVTDKERIIAFANIIGSGKQIHSFSTRDYLFHIQVDCYKGEKHLIDFCVSKNSIFIPKPYLHQFEYTSEFLESVNYIADVLLPANLWSLKARDECAANMIVMYDAIKKQNETMSYSNPNQWCDIVLKYLTNQNHFEENLHKDIDSETKIIQLFTCPSVYGHIYGYRDFSELIVNPNSLKNYSVSNYAINPNCKAESPNDMVLLFETKDGWNQHGGPELFTFNNHDPKGGCVLLNDGTVKFIRTEEELNNLKW